MQTSVIQPGHFFYPFLKREIPQKTSDVSSSCIGIKNQSFEDSGVGTPRMSGPDLRSRRWEHRHRMIVLVDLYLDAIASLNCFGLHGRSVGV